MANKQKKIAKHRVFVEDKLLQRLRLRYRKANKSIRPVPFTVLVETALEELLAVRA